MKKTTIFTQLWIIIAIAVVLNFLSESLYFRLDFTEDNRYTLSDATKNVLKNLDEVITVKVYFTEDLPAQMSYVKNDLYDILVEYEDVSDGNVVFEFVNPNESDVLKQEAMQNGIAPISINVVENDQRQQIQAFMGMTFKGGDKTEVVPLVQPGTSMEYDLTTSIKKIALKQKPKVGMIQGHGEPSLQSFGQLMQQLSVLYEVEPLTITDSATNLLLYNSLIWVNPQDTINPAVFQKLDEYINAGGKLFMAYSGILGDLQNANIREKNDIGLLAWLGQKGVNYGNQVIIDSKCASVTVQQRSGYFTINSQVEFPYIPRYNQFDEHPITKGIEALIIPFSNPLFLLNKDTSIKTTPLIRSSELSGLSNLPVYVDIQKQWTQQDFVQPNQVVAAAVEGIGLGNGKIVVIANNDFIINGEGQGAQQLNPDNVNFAANSIDWLSDDTGLIALRTKGITNRPLETVEDSTKNLIKYGNVFAPIILILVYSLFRKSNKLRKKQRWLQGNYN